jgi:hypothetical protein
MKGFGVFFCVKLFRGSRLFCLGLEAKKLVGEGECAAGYRGKRRECLIGVGACVSLGNRRGL